MTLGRFLILFAVGVIAALLLKFTWMYWVLGLSAVWVLFRLIKA